MRKKQVNEEQFNRMVTAILIRFMEFNEVPPSQRHDKLVKFNEFLKEQTEKLKNEESI